MATFRMIAADIERSIATGELRGGDRVPSNREIIERWGVAMATASKVLAALREAGLVEPVPGVGTVVRGPKTSGRRPAAELSRDRVVRTAVEIADAEGLDGLSMRRIAAALGAGPMS